MKVGPAVTKTTTIKVNSKMMETMKRYFLTFGVIAASILALSSCNREEDFTKEPEKNKVTFTFTAEKAGEETKTAVEEGTSKASYLWTTEDQANMHLYLVNGDTQSRIQNSDLTFNVSSDHKTMTITADVDEAESYTFRAVLAGAFSTNDNPQIKAVQNPATDNFDPTADLLVSDDLTTDSPSELALTFHRKAVINKMTLKNITSGEKVKSVVISSTKNLTGTFSSNAFTSGDKTIRLNYSSQPVVTGDFPVYFASIPNTGHELTVTVTTDKHKYTKTFGGSIAFNNGEFTRFSVGLPDGTEIDDVEGQYYIAAMPGAWVLMDGECSSTTGTGYYPKVETSATATAANITGADFVTVPNFQNYFWEIESATSTSGDYSGYSIKNSETGYYLACTTGDYKDSNYAGYSETLDDNTIFNIEVENKLATIQCCEFTTRTLRYNSSQPRFAFYQNNSQNPVYLIPTYDDGLTGVTLSFSQAIVNKTTSDYSSFTGLTVTADPNESSITSAITYGMTGDAIGTVNASTGVVTLNGSAGTATVTAVFSGDATYRQASASYMIVVSSASGPQYLLVSTVAEVTEGDYIITWNDTYYLPSGSTSGANPAVGTGITVANNKITNTVTDVMVWHFSGDNSDGFTISDGTNILNSTNTAKGITITTTSSRKWTVSVHETSGMLLRGDDGGTRCLAVYNSTDWRYYDVGSNYTGTLRLYKLEDSRSDPGMSWSANSASATITDQGVTFSAPTLTLGNASGVTYNSTNEDVATIDNAGEVTILAAGTTTIQAIFEGNTSYKPAVAEYTLTVTDETTPIVTYDFETVAELNGLVESTSTEYSGYLTNAVVSFVPATNTAIVKDATGSVMFYNKSGHGLKQGQTYTGAINVTAILYTSYNNYNSEVTAWDATFTGSESAVAPQSVTLSTLVGNYSTWQNAYVQVAGLTVTSVSEKNINVTDGTNSYVVYDNTSSIAVGTGDVITAIGTVTKHSTTEEIKVWKADDVIVTAAAPKAITFSQPSAGGSFTVKVDGNSITSGTTVASGTTVTLTATAASGYAFNGWSVSGATAADDSATTTTFTMGTSAVTIAANFKKAGSVTPDPVSLNVYSNAATVTGSGVGQTATWISGDITITAVKVSSTATAFRSSDSDHTRFYQGWSLTVTSASNTIDKVEFTCTSDAYATTLAGNTFSAGTASASSTKVTVSGVNASSTSVSSLSGQVRIKSITVTYK